MSFQSTRRDFLQAIGTGAVGLATAQLAYTDHFVVPEAKAIRRKTAKHLIVLNLSGGLSHIDTFDPKPDSAREYRNFDAACQTAIPGVFLSENLPFLAGRLNDVSLIRSLNHEGPATHEAGQNLWRSGQIHSTPSRPSWDLQIAEELGSVGTSGQREVINTALAAHVMLGESVGHLGQSPDAYNSDDVGLWTRGFRGDSTWDSAASGLTRSDLNRDFELRSSKFGTHALGVDCLRASWFIEQGARVVTIEQFATVHNQVTWDMHANGGQLRSTHDDYRQTLCPQLDQALSALLDDLKNSGLLSDTIVVVVSEMGRTPRINSHGGRDHHVGVWSGLIFGGPIRSGQVIGTSDAIGDVPRDRPVSIGELQATIRVAMGLDSDDRINRPIGELL